MKNLKIGNTIFYQQNFVTEAHKKRSKEALRWLLEGLICSIAFMSFTWLSVWLFYLIEV